MKATIKKSEVEGELTAPPSKSYTHRSAICAALAPGESKIINPLYCEDTKATSDLLCMLGAEMKWDTDLVVQGAKTLHTPENIMDCKGSGTTLRILSALSALAPGVSVLTGDDSLRKRPLSELLLALKQVGITSKSTQGNGFPPVIVHGGGILGGSVQMRGDISTQYISALLFACPKGDNETTIKITTELMSKPYVNMTLDVLNDFGIEIGISSDLREFVIPPLQEFKPRNYSVFGDYSSAAFILSAGALAGSVNLFGLRNDSKQGDAQIVQILKDMGAIVKTNGDSISVERSSLNSINIDATHIPDIIPISAVLATQAKGETTVVNAGRLKLKESNRLDSITSELNKMGAEITVFEDGLKICGPTELKGAKINPHNDHRIAMACAVAALVANSETEISDIECVKKSYPDFISDLKKIGADIECHSH